MSGDCFLSFSFAVVCWGRAFAGVMQINPADGGSDRIPPTVRNFDESWLEASAARKQSECSRADRLSDYYLHFSSQAVVSTHDSFLKILMFFKVQVPPSLLTNLMLYSPGTRSVRVKSSPG